MSPSLFTYSAFSLLFFCWSIFLFYWVPILEHLGFSPADAGKLLSLGLITRGVAAYWLYPIAVEKWGVVGVGRRLYSALMLLTLFLLAPIPAFAKALVSVAISTLLPIGIPHSETLGSATQKRFGVDYEMARIIGSSSFVLSMLLASQFVDVFGFLSAITLLVIFLVGLAVTFFKADELPLQKEQEQQIKLPWRYYGYLAIATAVQSSHAVYYAFGIKTFINEGLSASLASFLVAFGSIAEILFFLYCKRLGRLNITLLITLGAIGCALRWVLYASFSGMWIWLIAGAMHALSFSSSHLGFIYYVNRQLPPSLWAKGFGVYAAVSMSLGMGVVTALAAPVYEASVFWGFMMMSAVALIGVLGCIWVYFDQKQYESEHARQSEVVG